MLLTLLIALVETVPATPAATDSFTWLLVKMLVVLGAVCVLAVIVLKYGGPRLGAWRGVAGSKHIDIVARRALDPKKQLWIIRVGKRHFLLGSAEGAVNCLAELQDTDVRVQPAREEALP